MVGWILAWFIRASRYESPHNDARQELFATRSLGLFCVEKMEQNGDQKTATKSEESAVQSRRITGHIPAIAQ